VARRHGEAQGGRDARHGERQHEREQPGEGAEDIGKSV